MSAVPAIRPTEALDRQFQALAAKWREETAHCSSSTAIADHSAYRQIIALGPDVVPLLLRELEARPDHWFRALAEITGANPVPATERGRLDQMAKTWLRWAKDHGYQW